MTSKILLEISLFSPLCSGPVVGVRCPLLAALYTYRSCYITLGAAVRTAVVVAAAVASHVELWGGRAASGRAARRIKIKPAFETFFSFKAGLALHGIGRKGLLRGTRLRSLSQRAALRTNFFISPRKSDSSVQTKRRQELITGYWLK